MHDKSGRGSLNEAGVCGYWNANTASPPLYYLNKEAILTHGMSLQ